MIITNSISRRRTELMGLATLLIICFHAYVRTSFGPWRLVVQKNGNMAVDFFVLLSGFGCAFSLEKNRDIGAYYGRRMRRLLPANYAALALFALAAGIPSARILAANIIPIGVWVGVSQTYWYVGASVLYYILVPLFMSLMENARWPKIAFLGLVGVFSLIIPWMTRTTGPAIAIMRLPALVIGVALGVFHHQPQKKRDVWILAAMLVAIWAAGYGLMKHRMFFSHAPFDFITRAQANRLHKDLRAPLILVVAALALEGIERTPARFINAALRLAGRYSLELYLGHAIVRYAARHYLGLAGWKLLLVMLVAAWPVALAIRLGGKWLLALADKLPLKRRADRPAAG